MQAAAANAIRNTAISATAEQYLTFQLSGQTYGVEILRVQEIKGWEKPTRLPHSPEHVQGVINLRGAVVPILDLRRRFGLGETEYGRTTVVIVVKVDCERGELTAGIVVDAVCEVCNIDGADLRPAPSIGSAIDSHFVRGLAMVGDGMLVLLDIAKLVNSTLTDSATTTQAS
ncbi:MAG TPA: chemotaxis protein CheW [Steroidobacteraceae bacterium]|jgi:purine-binding chemotaxis protein CheW